ncbi:MAG: hypothetical protein WCA11_10910 [Terracidiphilus sp.]
MKQDVYRFAHEEASSELNEIVKEFDNLRIRKERIEKLLDALKPLADLETPALAGDQPSADAPGYTFQPAASPSAYSY